MEMQKKSTDFYVSAKLKEENNGWRDIMLEKIKSQLVVSCQALEEEPLHSSFIMGRMALAAKQGGAKGIRAQGKEDILAIKQIVDLPVIGIVKRKYAESDVYITATKKEIAELLESKCEMIAMDATLRKRPKGETLQKLLEYVHAHHVLAMADCSTYEECLHAQDMGFDCISTTLFGYTQYSEKVNGPNIPLLRRVVQNTSIPVIAEGKINSPQDLIAVMKEGVFCAVVGGAITRPKQITESFLQALQNTSLK